MDLFLEKVLNRKYCLCIKLENWESASFNVKKEWPSVIGRKVSSTTIENPFNVVGIQRKISNLKKRSMVPIFTFHISPHQISFSPKFCNVLHNVECELIYLCPHLNIYFVFTFNYFLSKGT